MQAICRSATVHERYHPTNTTKAQTRSSQQCTIVATWMHLVVQ